MNKYQLVYDAADVENTDEVGAVLKDSGGNHLTSTDEAGSRALDVSVKNAVAITSAAPLEITAPAPLDVEVVGSVEITTAAPLNVNANASFAAAQGSQINVSNTAIELTPAPLANRKRVFFQNSGAGNIWIGFANTVTVADGIHMPPGSFLTLDVQAGVSLYGISNTAANKDLRIVEFA